MTSPQPLLLRTPSRRGATFWWSLSAGRHIQKAALTAANAGGCATSEALFETLLTHLCASRFVRVLMIVVSPIAWPFGRVLDHFLGKGSERRPLFHRHQLKAFIDMHGLGSGMGGQLSVSAAADCTVAPPGRIQALSVLTDSSSCLKYVQLQCCIVSLLLLWAPEQIRPRGI